MSWLPVKIRTALALGLSNLSRVFAYRLSVKLGINPVRRIRPATLAGDFFRALPLEPLFSTATGSQRARPESPWPSGGGDKGLVFFGWYVTDHRSPPDWHQNPFNGKRVGNPELPWWKIHDFDPELGDIKSVWEASRFDWVLHFAQQAASGRQDALERLNDWLKDWCIHNPAYYGPNWKCGQEASIRVMHLAFAALILQQHRQPAGGIRALIKTHLQRIEPTMQYAIAQDNNHGTSEAAALFIGGSWLQALGDDTANKWAVAGRKWLENRSARLIEPDGSFSQYSLNYHRVMLDTYSMAEHWRNVWGLPGFSAKLYQKLQSATNWLYQMVQEKTGDAPNLGANDGARLLPLSQTDYRDYRPSVQLASTLFCGKNAYGAEGEWSDPLHWLGIALPAQSVTPTQSSFFPSGGYGTLRQADVFALLRFPRFRFRPGQADALHVDLWKDGKNLLRDGGTYSYNAGDDVTRYFGGTASHNTIQFDDRDQMPRLSRFLFGEWLKADFVAPISEVGEGATVAAGYRDYRGASHKRRISVSPNSLLVHDNFAGFEQKAVLRWRLGPDPWVIEGHAISNGKQRLQIRTDLPISRFEIVEGWESRYYLQKVSLPVLEVEVQRAGDITTILQFEI